ncbi:MAG TPA: apolipoprotein N-acyltransferase [Blastocatellia bacterium]|nr:apolipoprotein N-acyltransferase [Blastocatellia bacterium]
MFTSLFKALRAHLSHRRVRHTEEAVPPVYAREDMLAARFRVARVLPYQSSHTPFISNLSLAIFSGLLLVFAFPDWNLWSLGWVGTAPLIMAVVRERRFWRSLLLGSVTGTIFYTGSSHWVTYSMHNYGEIPMWLCYIILVIFSLTLGVFTGLFAAVFAQAIKRFGGWAILSAPVIWAASEWARIEVTGMGWNALGYSQTLQPAVIQVARLGGVYLVGAIMVAASAALVFALIYLEHRRGIIVLTAAGVIAIAAVLYGQSLRPNTQEAGSVNVAIIQPNIPIDGDWSDPNFNEQMMMRFFSLSEQAVRAKTEENGENAAVKRDKIGLVIWPESPMSFEYDSDDELRSRVAEFTRRNNVYLLMNSWGFPKDSGTSEDRYNSALVIAPSGEKIAEYDKIALVPFGEYVPARGWLPFVKDIHALAGDITPGKSITLSDVEEARLGTTICFEATRPDIARRMRLEGASALVQISNELWFGPTAAAKQMLAHAAFRAVENNCELIRATNTGLSARIDRYGVARGETMMFETATRTWKIQTTDEARQNGLTFYTRYGDVFAITCAALSLGLLVAPFIRKKETDND